MTNLSKEKIAELSKKLVDSISKLLQTGDWEESLFLRTMKKRLEAVKEEAQQLTNTPGNASKIIEQTVLSPDQVKVYISLYQFQGNNLSIWQNMLKALPKYSINRPIYNNEENARKFIRSKPDIHRHAYVIVAIKKDSIMPINSQLKDNFDSQLLTLKEDAIQTENILAFVHANKRIYALQNNVLTLKETIV